MSGMSYSYTLSVSRIDNLDCTEMAKYLSKHGIITSITSNISTAPHIEYGCRLNNTINSKDDLLYLWNTLTKKYEFKCGHLKIGDFYEGCILNYLRPTLCQTKKIDKYT
jgi:hypothetical protein